VFVQALRMRVAKASAATPCSGEILGDVECVHMLLGGFTGPCRGVAQVAVCDRPERIDPGYLLREFAPPMPTPWATTATRLVESFALS